MSDSTHSDPDDGTERPLKHAILNGLRLKCPRCGHGRLLHNYLKVNDECGSCHLDLRHQRADDGPAYLTILIIGHLMGFALHITWVSLEPEPWVMASSLTVLAVASALFLLPRMKGLIVAYQWAKRMHGF